MGCLTGALEHACRVLGFDQASGGDEVFAQLVLARIIEPVSKLDSLRVLEEAGLAGLHTKLSQLGHRSRSVGGFPGSPRLALRRSSSISPTRNGRPRPHCSARTSACW